MPEDFAPYTQAQVRDYLAYIDALIDPTVDALDLDAPETGIPWYKGMSKLSHQLLNLRHVQGHVGQLSELLMPLGRDPDWVGKSQGIDKSDGIGEAQRSAPEITILCAQ